MEVFAIIRTHDEERKPDSLLAAVEANNVYAAMTTLVQQNRQVAREENQGSQDQVKNNQSVFVKVIPFNELDSIPLINQKFDIEPKVKSSNSKYFHGLITMLV